MSTDIKLSKTQLTKIIQPSGFLRKTLGKVMTNLGKEAPIDLVVTLVKNFSPKLATKATYSILDKFERKNMWARSCKSRQRISFIYIKNRYG